MMGRDTNTFSYDSRQRATIMDDNKLKEKDMTAYQGKLQRKREDIREVLSMSNGDPVSLLSDVSAVQDLHGKSLDEQHQQMDMLKTKLEGMESLMRMVNMNIKSLRDSTSKDADFIAKEIKKRNPTKKVGIAVPENAELVDNDDEDAEEAGGDEMPAMPDREGIAEAIKAGAVHAPGFRATTSGFGAP